jgi:hypothetical protein
VFESKQVKRGNPRGGYPLNAPVIVRTETIMSDGREEREEQEKRREWERQNRRPDEDRIPDEDDWTREHEAS